MDNFQIGVLTVLGGKELIVKLLGPTADYLGGTAKDWTQKASGNLGRIFQNAAAKLGNRLELPGEVPPRILKDVLQSGAFCEDELAASYWGGVLASSRGENSRDDRGATYAALLSRLSTYEIRTHYLLYSLWRQRFANSTHNPGSHVGRSAMTIFVPLGAYIRSMAPSPKEESQFSTMTVDVLQGLVAEDLIGEQYIAGKAQDLQREGFSVDRTGIVVMPSGRGVRLMLWASGQGSLSHLDFLGPDFAVENVPGIEPLVGEPIQRST